MPGSRENMAVSAAFWCLAWTRLPCVVRVSITSWANLFLLFISKDHTNADGHICTFWQFQASLCLHLQPSFKTDVRTLPKGYCWGPLKSLEVGKRGHLYFILHCHYQDDSALQMCSNATAFLFVCLVGCFRFCFFAISLTVVVKVWNEMRCDALFYSVSCCHSIVVQIMYRHNNKKYSSAQDIYFYIYV